MSFSLDTRNVKYLHDHAAALEHHDSIKPIKNVIPDCRPVAERRKTHFNIRKHGEAVVVRLYATDIITYTPDNIITLNVGNYPSISTRAAIRAVAGINMVRQLGASWVQDHDGKFYPYHPYMQLQVGDHYGYGHSRKIINPVHPTVHTLNRKALSAIKKSYTPFITHLSGLIKLVGEDGFSEEMLTDVPYNMLTHKLIELTRGTHEQMHEAALYIAKEARMFGQIKHFSNWVQPPKLRVKLAYALKCFDNHIISLHANEVLTKRTIDTGKPVKDRYAWAVGK